MNIEPWVRLGIRISPKISEKPAESRNNRPPNVTLLTVISSQNVISAALTLSGCFDFVALYPGLIVAECGICLKRRSRMAQSAIRATRLSALRQRRIVARIDRMRQIFLLRPIPELA